MRPLLFSEEKGSDGMKKELSGVAGKVYELLVPVVRDAGCDIWDIDFVKEGTRRILRITIDAEGGVGIDDCERVHHAVDPVLDDADPIDGAYYLEVSSPGIERELTLERHIPACIGEKVEARLYAPQDGRRVFTGKLVGADEEGSVLICESEGSEPCRLPTDAIAKMKVIYDFGD